MRDQRYIYKRVALFFGALLSLYGFLLLLSWHFQQGYLLTLPPSLVPFPYMASLTLFLFGLGLLSIYTPPRYNLPNVLGFIIFVLSAISLLDNISDIKLITPSTTSAFPIKMTKASAIGYLWASIPLLFWKPYFRSSYKDHIPILFSLVLVVGGVFIISSYLANIHAIFVSVDAGSFNFWGVVGIMIYAAGMMASGYYFKTTTLMSRLMKLPIFITTGFSALAILLATAFSMGGEEAVRKMMHTKAEEIKFISNHRDLTLFKSTITHALGEEYVFTLYQDNIPILQINKTKAIDKQGISLHGEIILDDEPFTFILQPTSYLLNLFINRTVTYLIIVGGFTIAVTFGALYRMWQQAQKQIEINEKLHADLEQTIQTKNHILESAEIGAWKYDVEKDILYGDAFLVSLFGDEADHFQSSYNEFINLIDQNYHEYLTHCKNISIQTGKPFEATFPIEGKDGRRRHLLTKGRVINDKSGKPKYVEGIAWNITKIKRTQTSLEVSEAVSKLFAARRSISETSHQFIKILNNYFSWELFVLRLFNKDRSKLRCMEVASFPSRDSATFEKRAKSELVSRDAPVAGMVWSKQQPFCIKNVKQESRIPIYGDGSIQSALALPILEDSQLLGVIELYCRRPIIEDLDDEHLDLMVSLSIEFGQYYKKKIAEETQAELAAIVTNSHEGMYSLTSKGIVKSWNKGAEQIFGWTASEMIGTPIKRLYVSDFTTYLDLFLRKASHGDEVEHKETEAIKKNGTRVWVNRITTAIKDNNGKIQGACVLVEDITERKELEKTKHEFISMVSHELRTPLTSIHGAIALLKGDKSQPVKVKELMDVAYRNSERLTYLVNDILTIEKFELGKIQFQYEITSLENVIEEAIRTTEPLALKKSLKMIKEIDHYSDLSVKVERQRLMQVILNFLSNAIKFSHEGSEILITVENRGDYARVAVKDSGIGIPEDFKSKIFRKFFQANMGNTREAQGTGLGLYISKTIIEGMGGKIGFDSEFNKGSTFFFELPLVRRVKV